ncbi:hypothetical protein [Nocardioides speluncae]|uniref:hypothetical protein n=1 Tax=Nocardioides speluncae TaxID=2670337 RepID=UPI000D69C819|nr:hypothetical protein [Nocardioides speluncae]
MAFHLAGYIGASPTPRPDFLSRSVPDPLLTVSGCLADGLILPEYGWYDGPADVPGDDIVALGLAPKDAAELLAEFADELDPTELLARQQALPTGSKRLGFEVIGVETWGDVHSWHCHNYLPMVDSVLDVRVNELGLIPSYDMANRLLEWMLELPPEEEPEPVHWTIVALATVPNG